MENLKSRLRKSLQDINKQEYNDITTLVSFVKLTQVSFVNIYEFRFQNHGSTRRESASGVVEVLE